MGLGVVVVVGSGLPHHHGESDEEGKEILGRI